ncbi:MAG: dynamin family protein [Dermatophilaceae bacterium]
MQITCPTCGTENPAGSSFCRQCDAYLEWDDEVAQPRTASSPPTDSTSAAGATPVEAPALASSAGEPAYPRDTRVARAFNDSLALASECGRVDLAAEVTRARKNLEDTRVTVVVVGEYKSGKSTLINALLQTAACPADADLATSVPTVVTYGPNAGATAVRGDSEAALDIDLDEVASLVTEASPADKPQVRSVEIRVPHRMLRAGLRVIDTPGVGGLDSAYGVLTLGTLSMADGALFVTDASQELTAPELAFLKSVVERCQQTAVVVTRTDLHAHWRRIVELDRGHLAAAGLDLPVFAVSSFLRLRALREPALNAESGFPELVRHLASGIVAAASGRAAGAASIELGAVIDQISHQTRVEQTVLERPAETPALIRQLREANQHATTLVAPTSTWQQMLADGIQDLVADVDHDLQQRLRALLRDVDSLIDESDPKQSWDDTEAWLRRQVAVLAVENRTLLSDRAGRLAQQVAERFDLDAGAAFVVPLSGVDATLAGSTPMQPLGTSGGRIASMVVIARGSMYVPMVLFGLLSGLHLVLPGAGIALLLGAGIGQKLVRDEAGRQRAARQHQAKAVARKYVEEVAFVLNKDSRDALRETQRRLREDFQLRAAVLHRSTESALRAAQVASRLDGPAQEARVAMLAAQQERVEAVRARTLLGVPGPRTTYLTGRAHA